MSKRSADRELSKDDPDSEQERDAGDDMEEQGGTWQPASNEIMQGRVIVKARRKAISAPTGVSMPAFNFGATMPSFAAAAAASSASAASTTSATTSSSTPAAATASAPATATTAAPSKPASDAAAGWKCELCDTSNEPSATQCHVCDEAKPALANAPAAAAATLTSPKKADSTANSTTAAAASTGAAAESTKAAATPATSSSLSTGVAPTTTIFGAFGSSSNNGATGFSAFASAPKVQFEPSSSEHLLTTDETKAEFKHATAERTGEEDDEVHLRVATKVYQLKDVPIVADVHVEGEVNAAAAAVAGGAAASTSTPAAAASSTSASDAPVKTQTKYVEIGSGELHVNSVEDKAAKKTRARMVLREDRTKRNVLNAPLFTGMVYKMEGEKFVKFMSLDLEGKLSTFLLKFKEKSQAEDVLRAVGTCLDLITSST